MEEKTTPQQVNNEQGFTFDDFLKLCKRFWEKRIFIAWILGAFVVLGFLVAIFQTPVYTAKCTFVPQNSSKGSASSLSSLAAMAGISLDNMSSSGDLSALIYPKLLGNAQLNKDLIRTPMHFKKYPGEAVSFYQLSTDPKYKEFHLFPLIKKYTIGLPGVILGALRPKEEFLLGDNSAVADTLCYYSKEEEKIVKALSKCISLTVEKKDGYLSLSANYKEPVVAAELCKATFDLLQKYITAFKIEQAEASNEYIMARYLEAKADYEQKQLALAHFTDANRGTLTATAQIRKSQLTDEYNLSYALYTELSKQLLQSDMQVKKDTPVISTVEPIAIPSQKSNSRSKTLIIWCFFGAIVAFGSVFALDWLKKKNLGLKVMDKWE